MRFAAAGGGTYTVSPVISVAKRAGSIAVGLAAIVSDANDDVVAGEEDCIYERPKLR